MASIPQHHPSDNFISCNQHCEFPLPMVGGNSLWVEEEGLPAAFFENGSLEYSLLDHNMVPLGRDVMSSSLSATPFPERLGVSTSDMAVPVWPEFSTIARSSSDLSFESSACGGGGGGGGYYYHRHQDDVCEVGDEYCNGFVPDHFQTVFPSASNDNWGFQVSHEVPTMEEPGCLKVGKYSVEERKDRILRYLKKRNQRNFNKTIKYECRKTLADKRVRVRGRFARNNELREGDDHHQAVTKNNHNHNHNNDDDNDNNHPRPYEDGEFYNDETVKIKHDGDQDWLQEAIASFMYLPYISG